MGRFSTPEEQAAAEEEEEEEAAAEATEEAVTVEAVGAGMESSPWSFGSRSP